MRWSKDGWSTRHHLEWSLRLRVCSKRGRRPKRSHFEQFSQEDNSPHNSKLIWPYHSAKHSCLSKIGSFHQYLDPISEYGCSCILQTQCLSPPQDILLILRCTQAFHPYNPYTIISLTCSSHFCPFISLSKIYNKSWINVITI